MEYMTPLQGFMATSIVTSDVDNATIVLNSQGQVTLNTNYPNMWQAIQTFLNTISFDPSAGDVPILVEGNMAGVSSITYDSGFIGYNLANEGEIDIGVVSTATSALNIYKLTGTGPYTISGPIFTIDNAGNTFLNGGLIVGPTSWSFVAGSNPGQAIPYRSQGAYIGWNLSDGTGETDYLNAPGGGTGGHYFYNWNGSAWNNLAYIDDVGNFTALSAAGAASQGIIRAPNWNGTNWGLQIGANISGIAAIMINAPSGFSDWLEQFMVNGAHMWRVDASGNAVAAGTVSGAALAGGIINSNQTLASFAGTSAGTVYWSMPFQGTAYKKVIIYFDGYGNTTTTAQTITYPVAFAYTPNIYNPNSVAGLNATITELAINPVSTSTYTGFVVLEGF